MKLNLRWVLPLVAGCVLASPAHAYIPPSQFIVKRVAEKHAGFKGIRLRSVVTAMEAGRPTAVHFKQITLIDPATRQIRSRAYDDSGRELYAIDRYLMGTPNITRESQLAPFTNNLLFDMNWEAMIATLKGMGIPVRSEADLLEVPTEEERRKMEVSSLKRLGGTVAWVIGPVRKSGTDPQLWVEKDTFIPVRIIGKIGGESVDLQFESHRYFREFPFPKTITLHKPDDDKPEPLLRDELGDLVVNPDMAEIRSKLTPGFTDAGNSADGPVRDLIRRYYQVVR